MPQSILASQIPLIHFLQQAHSPVMDGFFRLLSFLGEEPAIIAILVTLWLGTSRKVAARLITIMLISFYLNGVLKNLFAQPRPFEVVPALKIGTATGYGLPSGHAQSSILLWGFLACSFAKTWFRYLAASLVLLIGLSRIYLGVHFPTDVLAGWLIGLLLLVSTLRFAHILESKVERLPFIVRLLAPADPLTPSFQRGTMRLVLGLLTTGMLYLLLHFLFPSFYFIRYALIGLWVIVGVPLLFGGFRKTPIKPEA